MTEQEVAQLGVPEINEAERKLTMISQDRLVRVDYERRKMAHHDAISLTRDGNSQLRSRTAVCTAMLRLHRSFRRVSTA